MVDAGPTDDEDLARRAAGGDYSAFTALVGRYSRRLIRFLATTQFLRVEQAEDVAQDVWVRVYQNLARRAPGSFSGWLFQVARNRATDVKRSAARAAGQRSVPADGTEVDRTPGPEELAVAAEARRRLARCVEGLPPEFRQVLDAHASGGSHGEIAEKYEIPVNTVKSRLSRSRERLAACLGGDR